MLKRIAVMLLGAGFALTVHATPEGEAAGKKFAKPGFVTVVEKGRLWVFAEGSKELEAFRHHGEPTVSVMRIGEGPDGMTIKSYSDDVINAYKAMK